ncbi:MAG: helix-turn-helix domain-containing protein [Actinomycetales bacterium]|nr:helix-turn-helix domain-containing protein [Actinomycetales bacterium]
MRRFVRTVCRCCPKTHYSDRTWQTVAQVGHREGQIVTTPASGGPTVRRILVGAQLRRLREAAGISREEAGYRIRGSESKISRMELGRVGFKDRDIVDLLEYYGVEDPEQRKILITMAKEANTPGWWHDYDDVLPGWFQTYVGLEEAASLIRTYEVQFVPGLLQTDDYARAVTLSGAPEASSEDVDRRVQLRMERQRLLTREKPLRLWAVVDEAALRRPMGGTKVMRGQIKALLEVSDMPNVTIQIMPFRFGGHAADGGPFSILRFAEPDLPDIVYLELMVSALYLEKREHVDRYTQTMDRLTVDSPPPEVTRETLRKILTQI